MKIKSLEIRNFRAIEYINMENLQDLVLIAGQNGVGKSCILDAIRLLKSSYGSYNYNEINSWFEEFQLRTARGIDLHKITRDKRKPLIVSASFILSEIEQNYLKQNAEEIISKITVRPGNDSNVFNDYEKSIAEQSRSSTYTVDDLIALNLKNFTDNIDSTEFLGSIKFTNEGISHIEPNIILEVLFSLYDPENIGIIDFHGANRIYNKENLQNINVNFEPTNNQAQQYSLYNYSNKYNNVKTELASSYIKALIAKESEENGHEQVKDLNNILKELFNNFFPGKSFKGMIPTRNGILEFPVELNTGEVHDISELSSGEKEILFGYLRLRNQAPKNSIIMIDEPELHLNPSLAKKLPEFYYDTIGKSMNNQIWLITHSDAILKEVVGNIDYSIFHMFQSENNGINQLTKISVDSDIELALIDLIGEFSKYGRKNKIVIFEGENCEFDKKMVNDLFPEFSKNISSISAGSKGNVANVQSILDTASKNGLINKNFYSVVDRDSDIENHAEKSNNYSWDVYHIENYLLNETYILKTLERGNIVPEKYNSAPKIYDLLKSCAQENISFHIQHEMNLFVTKELNSIFKFRNLDNKSCAKNFSNSIKNSLKILSDNKGMSLSENSLIIKEQEITLKFTSSLESDEWKRLFNGRIILKNFTSKIKTIRYELLRNLIISEMKGENFQPLGMTKIIEDILSK